MDHCRAWKAVLAVALTFGVTGAARADDAPKATVGKVVVVIPANARGVNYFPDEQISFLGKNPTRLLMVSGTSTVLMQGPSVAAAAPRKTVLEPGKKTDFDNGYAGI